MGGFRITKEQIEQAKELRRSGLTYEAIARKLGVSIGSVTYYAKGTPVCIRLDEGEKIADVTGYEGLYKITSHGRLFSTLRKKGADNTKEIKPHERKSGIRRVALARDGKRKEYSLDKLVATEFVRRDDDACIYVRHKDGDLSNNMADNLEWVKDDPGKDPFAYRKPVIPESDVETVRKKWLLGVSLVDLAKEFNVSVTTISKQVRGLKRPFSLPQSAEGEVWSKINGFDDRYYISSHGRLFSSGAGRRRATVITPSVDWQGYQKVELIDADGNNKTMYIHRLVASMFCDGRSESRNVVNHKDGDPSNNHADNLEWCTMEENVVHATKVLGTMKGGDQQVKFRTKRVIPKDETLYSSPLRRFTDDEVRAIRSDPRSSSKVADEYGVNKCTISKIRRGITYRNV